MDGVGCCGNAFDMHVACNLAMLCDEFWHTNSNRLVLLLVRYGCDKSACHQDILSLLIVDDRWNL